MENKIIYNGEIVAEVSEVGDPVFSENNKVVLIGKFITKFEYNHKDYYRVQIRVGENTEKCLWVMVPKDLSIWKQMKQPELKNRYAKIAGEILVSNGNPNIYARSFDFLKEYKREYVNLCYLKGAIVKIRFYNKRVEMLLKVKNDNGQVNFIKCLALKNKAKYAKKLEVGMEIELLGEIERIAPETEEKLRIPKINIKKMKKCM